MAEVPAFVLERVTKQRPQGERTRLLVPQGADAGDGALWLRKALDRCGVGTRNATGFWLACQLRDAGISESDAGDVLRSYAQQVPGEGYTEREALASLAQAYRATPREPARIFTAPPAPDVVDAPPPEPLEFPTERTRDLEVEELREENRRLYALLQREHELREECLQILALPPEVADGEDKRGWLWFKLRGLDPEGDIITREEMARGCAFSEATASTVTGHLEELEVVRKTPDTKMELKTEPAPDGTLRTVRTWHTLNSFAPAAHWAINAAHYPTPARPRPKQGGLRIPKPLERCLYCGSTNLLDTTHRHCNDCQHDHALRHDFPNSPPAANSEKLGEVLVAPAPPSLSSLQSGATSTSPLNSDLAADEQRSIPATVGVAMDEIGGEACTLCGAPVDLYDEYGHAFCDAHAPPLLAG